MRISLAKERVLVMFEATVRFKTIPQTKEMTFSGFEVMNKDNKWIPAKAVASERTVALHVQDPVFGVRYAWQNIPTGQALYLGDDDLFPASPFVASCSSSSTTCTFVPPGHVKV